MNNFNYKKITAKEIENMLYQITAHAGHKEAKRFNRLSLANKQKATFILQKRAERAKQAVDYFIVREVIDDVQRGLSELSL